jgi:transposase-like protein
MAKKQTPQKKTYDPQFKAEVAIMALSQMHTAEAVAKHFGVNKTQVNSWRNILKDNAAQLFVKGKHDLLPDNSEEVAELKRKIGHLVMENELLKKNHINARKASPGADRLQSHHVFHCSPVQNVFYSS